MTTDAVRIAPSILSADFLHLADELESIRGADLVHFDVMDGHFVPNLSFGPGLLRQVKAATGLPLDVHLMVDAPEESVVWYLEAGADIVSFHWESQRHAHRLVSLIHEHGAQAAIALNPATPAGVLDAIVGELDMVLVMSVNPGFGGQSFIEGSLGKVAELRALCQRRGSRALIEVDGGVGTQNARALVQAGASVLVAGSSVFGAQDRGRAIAELRASGEQGLGVRG